MNLRGKPDFLLLILTLILVGIGLVMIYSSSSVSALFDYKNDMYYLIKQLTWAGIGIIMMIIIMNIPYSFFKNHFVAIMIISLILLIAVAIPGIGSVKNGARSWIVLGSLGSFQPSEFAKLALIIYLSALITKKGEKIRTFKKGLVPTMAVSLVLFGLIAKADLGSSMILIGTAVLIIFAGGAKLKHLGYLALVLLGIILLFIITSPYRVQRLLNYQNPWNDGLGGLGKGYQLVHSYFALAHGGWMGAGFGKSIEKYLYLPESQTDFIFAIFSEEMGFLVAALFILFYLLFLWRILIVTFRVKDQFANLVGIGIVSMTFIQAFLNIGGVIGLLPITGVPLPFISYGGSSLLINLMSMGIVLSISREYSKQRVQKMIEQAHQQAKTAYESKP